MVLPCALTVGKFGIMYSGSPSSHKKLAIHSDFLSNSPLANTSFMVYYQFMDVEWKVIYYSEQDGSRPVEQYIDNLSLREQAKTLAFIGLLEKKGPNLPRPYADLLDEGIHELRIKLSGTQVRILYFFCYQNIIFLTNVFDKHSDKVPKEQIKLAKENRTDFLNRFSEKDVRENLL
jgi:hypothetical protein